MKYALGIEYNGSHFHGWQKQPGNIRTVQTVLEKGLSKVADENIHVVCAGRTDTGVHGLAQVIHFETSAIRKDIAWVFGANSFLPSDIRVLWLQKVEDDFHARFSAINRSYEYVILNTPNHSALLHKLVTWECRPLNVDAMSEACNYLLGTHDFSSFRAAQCQAHSPVRTLDSISVINHAKFIHIKLRANAFLHHMVRNIVGVLLDIGQSKQPPEWMRTVLNAKNRSAASRTAPADGLYLIKVTYPDGILPNNVERTPRYA